MKSETFSVSLYSLRRIFIQHLIATVPEWKENFKEIGHFKDKKGVTQPYDEHALTLDVTLQITPEVEAAIAHNVIHTDGGTKRALTY